LQISTILSAALVAATAFTWQADAADYTIDVSLDTSPNHVRNRSFREFAEALNEKSDGRLELRIFDSASKYKGPMVATAVAQGAIDMAAPAHQHLSKFVPETGILLLPMFYGQEKDVIYNVVDGEVGQKLNKMIEDKLRVVVLGRPFDLGYGTVFSTDLRMTKPADLEEQIVRVPGGAATLERYKVFKANPTQIPWSDVPQALQTGAVSTIWATQESVASAQLWDAGIKYAFEDKQAFIEYVPILSQNAWSKLPEDLQQLMIDTWDEMVDDVRKVATKAQEDGRQTNADHGIETVDPDPADLAVMREKLMAAQPAIVEELGMDTDFINEVSAAVAAAEQ
tara:strand:+ start:6036 stop:7052 length:1017 start_codon:yes stop_codon:yes gene_type:complete